MRSKHAELNQQLQLKSHKLNQLQELHDRMKRKTMLGQVQNAASNAVEDAIQRPLSRRQSLNRIEDQVRQHNISLGEVAGSKHLYPGTSINTDMRPPPPIVTSKQTEGDWPGFDAHTDASICEWTNTNCWTIADCSSEPCAANTVNASTAISSSKHAAAWQHW